MSQYTTAKRYQAIPSLQSLSTHFPARVKLSLNTCKGRCITSNIVNILPQGLKELIIRGSDGDASSDPCEFSRYEYYESWWGPEQVLKLPIGLVRLELRNIHLRQWNKFGRKVPEELYKDYWEENHGNVDFMNNLDGCYWFPPSLQCLKLTPCYYSRASMVPLGTLYFKAPSLTELDLQFPTPIDDCINHGGYFNTKETINMNIVYLSEQLKSIKRLS